MDLDHERRLTEVEGLTHANARRLDDVERRQDTLDELVGTVKVLATREEVVESDVKEIKSNVKALIMKPAKRWDDMVDKITLTVVAALVGFILAKIGF